MEQSQAPSQPSPPDPPSRDTWQPSVPLGYPESVQSLGGFAAPLLAAAGFGILAAILPTLAEGTPKFARWPETAASLIVLSSLAQIAAVQATMWARRYLTTPDELSQWWPGEVRAGRPTAWLQGVQRSHQKLSAKWADRARLAYHLGILTLLAGLVVLFVPPETIRPTRYVLIAISVLGFLGEAFWLITSTFLDQARRAAAIASLLSILLATAMFLGWAAFDGAAFRWTVALLAIFIAVIAISRGLQSAMSPSGYGKARSIDLASHGIVGCQGLLVAALAVINRSSDLAIWTLVISTGVADTIRIYALWRRERP